MLPIARFLIQEGHQVCWITGRKYRQKVESTGARFYPLPSTMDPHEQEMYDFYPALKELKGTAQIKYYLKHVFLDNSRKEMEVISELLRAFPAQVLIGDNVTYGVYFKAEQLGMPSLCLSLLPFGIPSKDTAPFGLGLLPGSNYLSKLRNQLLNWFVNRVAFSDVNRHTNQVRKSLGLTPFPMSFFESIFGLPTKVCQLSTASFEYIRGDLPGHIQFVGPVFPQAESNFVLPDWWNELKTDKPVVLINQGTMATDINDLIKPAIEALKEEDVLVVAVPVKQHVELSLPANVRVASYIPFAQLLPHVDLMVTNGGYGGTQQALAHGIPLVVAGGKEDKMEVAARVEWSGAGINLRVHQPAPSKIREAVKKVLTDPTYRQNAQRLQVDITSHNTPYEVAQLLEQVAKVVSSTY